MYCRTDTLYFQKEDQFPCKISGSMFTWFTHRYGLRIVRTDNHQFLKKSKVLMEKLYAYEHASPMVIELCLSFFIKKMKI